MKEFTLARLISRNLESDNTDMLMATKEIKIQYQLDSTFLGKDSSTVEILATIVNETANLVPWEDSKLLEP
ncbi:hypothetical protein M0802_006252 [Mischocyttarus mexicanus]|nr:hypothetical protein M0802_006252 [Mischocyttarus mexicanus]